MQQQPPGAPVVVVAADDQVEAVVVRMIQQRLSRGVALDDLVLHLDACALCAVGHVTEGLLEAVGGGGGFAPVGAGLGVCR